ncbi:coiled-coil domain-containing protein 191 isoform X2 [Chanodichthys erythropterus]|uniref:coiled-coil domain-containing protein 191 isoform X2 n=1 Tax=Chanodichthys erythropterus TaxID=933992 RepID=UPI00351E34BD
MASPIHRPDIFRWKTTKTKTPGSNKVQLNENDIKQWVKRVEMASEFAVAEVFSMKKPHCGKNSMALQSVEQLQDHDDAYSEAQSILSEWMNQKLRLELEMDDDEEEEEMSSNKKDDSECKQLVKTTQHSYNNFDDMYFHLEQEEDNSVVHNFLQDLMETEVLDFGIMENLKVDSELSKKKWRDPSITMEVRHKQCIHRHFTAWYSVIMERRVRMGKAAALCDWRRQLRAWRAWRALVWAKREEKEAERTEEELRQEHRRSQQAVESDRRRLLRRCLSDWRMWCQVELHRKELLQQQEETRRKMAALISAAASGKLRAEKSPPITNPPETLSLTEHISHQEVPAAPESSSPTVQATKSTGRSEAPPTQAWQVTHRHAALSMAELRRARQGQQTTRSGSAERGGGQFKHGHVALQQTVAEQRRLLKEQQEQIQQLQERQNILELRHEAEKSALLATGPPGAISTCCPPKPNTNTARGSAETPRTKTASGDNASSHTDQKSSLHRSALPHPTVQAMEERARQRAERRREIEEQRRQKQEEKLAQMKAAEEERLRAEEEEKQKEVERKKEEKRQQRKRELEKQKRAEREQELSKRASQHYLRTLLLHRGLAPWKRLLEQSHVNTQRAVDHCTLALERSCFCSWRQSVDEAHAEREASANQLYHRILLQRAVCSWKRLKDLRCILEARAERFHKMNTQRKVFTALLDHATEERITAWDNEQRAEEHHSRRAVKKCFAGWRRLPVVLREEKEREARRDELRRKVAEILPDFRASPIDSLWRSVNPL